MTWKTGLASLTVVGIVTVAYALGGGAGVTRVNGTPWRNSLTEAQAEAKRTGKPILLLSMFGKLDEDMPCANARTLRATLFKDPEFRAFLDKEAIPVWEMVRPVPRVTIDFGDGKKVVRTVRGNAVMYLVNADGKVFDAFPGIYTKKDFMPAVRESIAKLAKANETEVTAYHAQRAEDIRMTLITGSKSMAESPTLNLIGAKPFVPAPSEPITAQMDPARRRFLLSAYRLTDMSLTPLSTDSVVAQLAKGVPPDQIPQTILENDSRTNMQRTRAVVHLYFASEKALPTPAQARDAVLATILKIPYKDPTMGLSDVLMPGTPAG